MKTLESDRLILRDISFDDLNDFFEYSSNGDVATSSGWLPHKTIEESKTILDRLVNAKDVYAIIYKENNKMIGTVGVHEYNLDFTFEGLTDRSIGYALSKEYWSRGLMTEAFNLVIDHCFKDLGIDILWAGHLEDNISSKKLLESIGFTYTHKYNKPIKEIKKSYRALAYILRRDEFYK